MAPTKGSSVFSIGYEKQTPESLFSKLQEHGIKVLFDVRLKPASRITGMSKTALMNECKKRGLEYRHNKLLGTPKDLLELKQVQHGYDAAILKAYRGHLKKQPEALAEITKCATDAPTCLLCLEKDPSNCHRSVILDEMSKKASITIHHL